MKELFMNLEQIAEEIGITADSLRSMYRSFLKNTENDLKEIEAASGTGDLKALRSHAHHIKGAANNLELTELGETARKLEYAAKNEEGEKIATLRKKLASAFRTQEQKIKEMLT